MNAQSITNLAYESINEKYSKAKYGDFDVIMDMSNGYINGTKLCADGGKKFYHWMENTGNKELMNYFQNNHHTEFRVMTIIITGGQNTTIRGTYVHPDLIPHIASWVSPSFAHKVSIIVNNYMAREREEELRKKDIIIDKHLSSIDELKDMIKNSDKQRIEENRQLVEENKKMLQKMTEQNEKTHQKLDDTQKTLQVTHAKLDKADNANEELQNTLDVVVTRLEIVADEIVKPSKRVELHEQFVVMKLNDAKSDYSFKVFCSQNRNVAKAKNSILKQHRDATVFLEITPSPNSKNFLHNLKDLYGTEDKDAKLNIYYNYISLVNGTLESELCDMVNKVVEDAKNLGTVSSI